MTYTQLIGKPVEAEITGKVKFFGHLVDAGLDIIVLFNGTQHLYIPLLHLHSIQQTNEFEDAQGDPPAMPLQGDEQISYRKTLNQAKGIFTEIYVTGNKSLHGYITNVLNDYLVFYSPVFKNVFISLHHLKWLIPYPANTSPYTLNSRELPVTIAGLSVSRNLEEQLKKQVGQMIVFDLAENPDKLGLLKNIDQNMMELIKADGQPIYLKISHVKAAHLP
ncbi:DUF2642 domain-containing protein [Bacillus sp. FJAT-42376]|uniref:DUF2642 domain-containing protein n=1 Tax=Bacillus sp. FJAT-42376 TaxID=2014076 RepID=UPI000F4FCC3A|nr:DUF2642 domain-containing protein [Bacillus sp. FJAT-42376]AZB43347.1 DUF2642 domain-containing protein [Bacillus sp. FJAT-42376]